ncbi:hypothetical protein HanRHA438_Chr12g0540951 [Helianthus annuus]|nr:hypothetical protein HanRHA438_Chr12g0540951 [Helianthus annuus]
MRGIRSRDGIRRLIISIQNQLLITILPITTGLLKRTKFPFFYIFCCATYVPIALP